MRKSLPHFVGLVALVALCACDNGRNGTTQLTAPPPANDLLSCSGAYGVGLTTGGDTYYTTSDCSGQAYAVDGFCTSEPYKTAVSTFGCAQNFDACYQAIDMHSARLHIDPDSCRSVSPDGSDFVPVQYNASWTCCNDGDCSSPTPHCALSGHQCVECANDSQCSGGTPYCYANECVECTTDSQCGSGEVCSNNECTAECTPSPSCNGRHCSEDAQCWNGTCAYGTCTGFTCVCPS